MDVVISAGSTPGKNDLLLQYAGASTKALIPVAYQPMIKWITDAFVGSRYIDRLILVGLDASCGIDFGSKPVLFLPSQGRLVANYVAGVERSLQDTTDRRHVLIAACDIPLITTSMVDDHIAAMLPTNHDVYYTVIRKETMLAKFPTSRRSYTRLREGIFCGGSLHMISSRVLDSDTRKLWNDVLEARKNVFRQAALVGFDMLLRLITGTLTLAAAEKRADKVLGVRCTALITPHAEIGMDVDKPFQLDIVRAMLNEQ